MYSIEATYTDGNGVEKTLVVYDDVALDQRLKVVGPVLELEDNSAGSLEFTIYPTNHAYGSLEDSSTDPLAIMVSTVRVFMEPPINDPGRGSQQYSYTREEIWEGRPLSSEKDFYNGKKIYCEGALCYLNDIDQPAEEYTAERIQNEFTFSNKKSISGGNLEFIDFIKAVLTQYNLRAAYNRKFDIDGVYVNPNRIPLNYNFKGCLADKAAIEAVQNPSERDIYQTMTGLSGYASRGYVDTVSDLDDVSSPQTNDICYVVADEKYYLYDGSAWGKTDVMDYVGEYYVYTPDPKVTTVPPRMIWSDVTTQIHLTCGISRSTGGENTKETIAGLVESFGGHIKVRTVNNKRCIYYTAKVYPEDEFIGVDTSKTAQSVDFGKNLIELTKKRDGSEFFTVLLPIGAEISNEHPETIETMCENVIAGGDFGYYAWETDLTLDERIQPYDATQQSVATSRGNSPRRYFAKNGLEPGYTYYLFTTSYNQNTRDDHKDEQQNNYMYFLYDSGPNRPNQSGSMGGVAHPYYAGTLYSGETYSSSDVAIYKNDRLLAMKQLQSSDTVEEVVGEAFHIPELGSGDGYSLYFSCATLYAKVQDGDLPPQVDIPAGYWDTHTLLYPRLYKNPYPDKDTTQLKVRKVDDHYIWWAGCTKYGGAVRNDIDPHKCNIYSLPVTDKYGTDDFDLHVSGDSVKLIGWSNTGWSSWHKVWDDQDDWQASDSMWKPTNNANWIFPTGYTGHHVARVLVEAGKTYYLNTRVTNPGFPKSHPDGSVTSEGDLPVDAPIHSIYTEKNEGGAVTDYWGKTGDGFTWTQPWGGGDNKDYTHADGDGKMRGGRDYYDVIAYAIVVRRPVYYNSGDFRWEWQILEKKLANRSQCATVFNMEEIKIPAAVPPESVAKPGEVINFYDSEGNATPNAGDQICHIELWFTCDQCYVNGNGEVSDDQDDRRFIGYFPEVFVEDETAFGNEKGTNYKNHVTIKPLQTAGCNGPNWPEEYLINKELYDQYGPIVKVASYENATTPTQLMTYAKNEIDKMKGEESFEVSAVDMKSCGLEDCDRLRLMQKIKINDSPHGIDASIVLSKMSLDLMDLAQNSYTLGYEANRGISSM